MAPGPKREPAEAELTPMRPGGWPTLEECERRGRESSVRGNPYEDLPTDIDFQSVPTPTEPLPEAPQDPQP